MKKIAILAAAAAALAACAKSPEAIMPSYVSPVTYQSWNCRQLGEEQQRVAAALTTASAQQQRARSNDIAGVILLGLPVSSLSGDNIAPEVARLKGESEVIQKTMIVKSCTSTVAPQPPSSKAKSS